MSVQLMTIGQLARKSGLTPRAIRYYERIDLLKPPLRSESNYRLFDFDSLERVRFISKCRSLGFSLAEITNLLSITDDPDHTCAQVEEVTRRHLKAIDTKLQSLVEMREPVAKYVSRCTGRDVPDCALLDYLRKTA